MRLILIVSSNSSVFLKVFIYSSKILATADTFIFFILTESKDPPQHDLRAELWSCDKKNNKWMLSVECRSHVLGSDYCSKGHYCTFTLIHPKCFNSRC